MNTEGKSIQRLVWGLVGVTFLVGVVTIGVLEWTLSTMRAERTQLIEEEQQLLQASKEIGRLGLGSKEEIENMLLEGSIQSGDGKIISSLQQVVQKQLDSTSEGNLKASLIILGNSIGELEQLWNKARLWKTKYLLSFQDIKHQRTLGQVRRLLHTIGAEVASLEGRRRLKEVIQLRRWKAAKEPKASSLAKEILTGQANQKNQALREIRIEIGDVGRLVEVLAAEQQADNLTNIKDNKLKPSIARLTRSLNALESNEALQTKVGEGKIEALNVALFGRGYSIDKAHQTVRVGEGGLYALRSDVLSLREEREKLGTKLEKVTEKIDDLQDKFSQLARASSNTLTSRVEQRLNDVFENMLFVGGFSFAGFLGLALMISRGIRRQVSAIEETRAIADENNRMTQKLLTEHQASAEALRKAQENLHSIFENAVEGIYQSTPDGQFMIVNPALARMYGYETPEEMMEGVTDIGHQVYVNPKDQETFARMMNEQGYVQGFEYQIYRRDGNTFWISENARSVRNSDRTLLHYEGTIQDISEKPKLKLRRI
jgi:PAS domain S-box-containing protein